VVLRLSKRRIYEIVEKAEPGDRASWVFDIGILTLIVLNIVALCLETVESIRESAGWLFQGFETLSVIVFSLEYVLRLWSVTSGHAYRERVWGRVRFALTPLALIDLLAVLPWYLPFFGVDLRFVRGARMFRLLRVAKFSRYSRAIHTFGRVFYAKKEELTLALSVLLLLLLFAASLMYFAESGAQPEAFSSIPASMWWAVATLSTVGYGDVYPITTIGKIIASVIAFLGVAVFAIPTGIVGAGFVEALQKQRGERKTCPHCGEPLDP